MGFKKFIHYLYTRDLFDYASQLSYYFLISLFPFLLVLVTVISYLPVSSANILDVLANYAPSETYVMLKENLHMVVHEHRDGLLSISILITIYVASLGFQSLIRILDKAYKVEETRPLWKEFTLGFLLMLGLMVAFLSSLTIPMLEAYVNKLLIDIPKHIQIFLIIRWLLSSIALFGIFMGIYILAPNLKVTFRRAWPGALIATFGWQASSVLFAYYVSLGRYSLVYGNLGGIIILLGWIYWSSLMLVIGGYTNAYFYNAEKDGFIAVPSKKQMFDL